MNKEKAISVIKDIRSEMEDARDSIAVDALDIAIKSMEEKRIVIPVATISFDDEKMQKLADEAVANVIKERQHGEWIRSDDKNWLTCPFCDADIDVSVGVLIYVDNDEVSHINFCPNCGASMRKEGDA